MLHAQEEPGWGADKEKIKALDLARWGLVLMSALLSLVIFIGGFS